MYFLLIFFEFSFVFVGVWGFFAFGIREFSGLEKKRLRCFLGGIADILGFEPAFVWTAGCELDTLYSFKLDDCVLSKSVVWCSFFGFFVLVIVFLGSFICLSDVLFS